MTRDPADAFVELFDACPKEPFLSDDAERARRDTEVLEAARQVESEVLRTGSAEGLSDLPPDAAYTKVIARLIGLDRVLRRVHPKAQAPVSARLQHLAARYARKGRLNKDTDGLLLPRLVEYGAPNHRPDKFEFFSVVRVPNHMLENVRFQSVGAAALPTLTASDRLLVGCVPFMEDSQHLDISRVDAFDQARYRMSARVDTDISERVMTTLSALDESGAVVGLLPEGALSADLLTEWKAALAATFRDARRAGSHLAAVLVGSGVVTDDEPPRNRAVMLDRTGTELWKQDKLCDFTLVSDSVLSWGLTDQLPPAAHDEGPVDLLEDITLGSELVVAETPLGRFAVLICEDLQRSETRQVMPRNLGVSHIFTPVFDAPLDSGRWERFAAERHVLWGGSRVAVANSRVVGALTGQTGSFGTALGMAPSPNGGTWTHEVLLEETTHATEVALLNLPAVGPPGH